MINKHLFVLLFVMFKTYFCGKIFFLELFNELKVQKNSIYLK